MIRLNAPDRTDAGCDEVGGVLAAARDDGDVVREAVEAALGEVRTASGHEDATVRASGARSRLPRLADRFVRDATRVDDRDVGAGTGGRLEMPVGQQAGADRLRVGERDLAAEETGRERRHPPPSLMRPGTTRSARANVHVGRPTA